MEAFVIIAVLLIFILFSFSSAASEIPFFPTHDKDLPHIIKALKLSHDHIVLDLGAGTGTVIFAAALDAHRKGLDTKFLAIDINFTLVAWMHLRRLFHPNRDNIVIMQRDLFKTDYRELTKAFDHITYYLYVSPWLTEKIARTIEKTRLSARIVSYFYPIEHLKAEKVFSGKHKIYQYQI